MLCPLSNYGHMCTKKAQHYKQVGNRYNIGKIGFKNWPIILVPLKKIGTFGNTYAYVDF